MLRGSSFNTSITGYQEIFTDPSYCGQIVVLTNPEIGNYGTNAEDNEATRPYIEGLIVREFPGSAPTGARSRSRKNISSNSRSRCWRYRHARPGSPSARQRGYARRHLDA